MDERHPREASPSRPAVMSSREVIDRVRERPWADDPWARPLVETFPDRLREALWRWDLTIEQAWSDGAGLPVLAVHRGRPGRGAERDAGSGAVLKFADAVADLDQQAEVLRAAGGRGYVRLLDQDTEVGAVLLERLGPSLGETTPDPVARAETLVDLLPATWALPLEVAEPCAGDQKARSLLTLIEDALERGGDVAATSGGTGPNGPTPCVLRHEATLDRARELARELAATSSAEQVVVHGDPHAANVLLRGSEHVLIDPEGFRCEPEYDVGVTLRDHQREIDELDVREGVGAGRRWHARLVDRISARVGLDPDRVAAWAGLERVTTGIYLGRLGFAEEGEAWLATAERVLV